LQRLNLKCDEPLSNVAFSFNLRRCNLEVLKWARDQDPLCEWHSEACAYAAGGGHLAVLQWAREHDCPWASTTCEEAAAGGHVAVLQWAIEHGYPWDVDATCEMALAAGAHTRPV